MDRDALIAAYNRFVPRPQVDDAFLVSSLGESSVIRVLECLEGGERFPKILLAGQAGCGKSTVLRRVSSDSELKRKKQVIGFSVMEELNILDATVHDLTWLVYAKLTEAVQKSGIEPMMDGFDSWIDSFAHAFEIRKRGPALIPVITRRIQADAKCRRALRELMISEEAAFFDLLDAACDRFSRFTLEYYRLTGTVFNALQKEDVSENILTKLRPLEGTEYTSELRFMKDVQEAIGDIQAVHYQPLLLKHAWVEAPKDPVVVIDDTDKLSPRNLSRIFFAEPDRLARLNAAVVMTFPLYGVFLGGGEVKESAFYRIDLPVRHPSEKSGGTAAHTALTDLVRKRLGDDVPFHREVTELFVRKCGGVPGDLLTLMQDFLNLSIDRMSDAMDPAIAETAVTIAETDMMRAFSKETHGAALEKVMKTRSLDHLEDAEKIYFLRRNYVLRYAAADGGEWFDVHPFLGAAGAGDDSL